MFDFSASKIGTCFILANALLRATCGLVCYIFQQAFWMQTETEGEVGAVKSVKALKFFNTDRSNATALCCCFYVNFCPVFVFCLCR